jgi:hypothetical protein
MGLRTTIVVLALAGPLAGCGGATSARSPTGGPSNAAQATARPALAKAPKRPGEILVQGDVSPGSHGPFTLNGRYTARFEQIAPENPNQDFTTQTAFVAVLDKRSQIEDRGTVHMFRAAERTGRKEITARGRYFIDVSFGDYPYAIRLTPARQR